MAKQRTFSNLAKEMNGKETVNGWDVLVSYPLDTVNKLLAARSKTMEKVLSMGPLATSYEDPATGEPVKMTFSMKLDHPLLAFEDQYGNVTLTFEVLKGSYTVKKPINLPPGLILEFRTHLVAVSGKVNPPSAEDSSEFKPYSAPKNEDKDIQGPNYTVIINPDDKGAARGVYIDLRKATVTLKGKDEVSQTTAKRLNTIIKGAIEDYFAKAAAIDYYLAGVSNDYKSQAADHVLRPVSFCFTTVMGNDESEVKSALCMWIAVQGGKDGGRKPTGATQVTFHPGSSDLISIPKGSTASLIVSNYVLLNHFFLPNLSKGFDDIKETTVAGEGGLKFTGKLKADTVSVEKVDDSDSGPGWWWYTKMDAIEFEPSDPLTDITISGDTSSNQKDDDNRIKYTSNGQSANWEWGQTVSGVDNGDSGTVELVFTWNGKGTWKDVSTDKSPNLLGFDWTQDEKWNITSKDTSRGWWAKFWPHSSEVPPHFRNLSVPGPRINLTMDPLDYFLTTNLLFPGEQIFKADKPTGECSSKGLAVPRDLILTGDIKEN